MPTLRSRTQEGSKRHGTGLSPRENTVSETRVGCHLLTLLPPLPGCLPGFVFPMFTICVFCLSLTFRKKKRKILKMVQQTPCTHPSFESPSSPGVVPMHPYTIPTPYSLHQHLASVYPEVYSTLATTLKNA